MDITKYKFFKKLTKLPYVDAIMLFGSRIRKDNQERSDIDIAVSCPSAQEDDWLEVIKIVEDADTLLKIDCVRLDQLKEENALKKAISNEGEYIFKRMTDKNSKVRDSFSKLNKALRQLENIVIKPADPDRANIDATIQRFEFTIELFWKLLKRLIEALGRKVTFPKEVLQEAYAAKMIDDEKLWLRMLEDRNLTSHTYNEELADKIYNNIKIYSPIMQRTYDRLYKKYGNL